MTTEDKKKAAAQAQKRHHARVKKARTFAAHFYMKSTPGYVDDWINDTTEDINLAENIDKDIRDLSELLLTFHTDCIKEGL